VPTLDGTIDDVILDRDKTITRTIIGIPASDTLAVVAFTVKDDAHANDEDDSAALIHKVITPVNVPGTGQITDTGASGTATIRIDCKGSVDFTSVKFSPDQTYAYDITGWTAGGIDGSPEIGTIRPVRSITKGTAT
jgi:hypothetical protein